MLAIIIPYYKLIFFEATLGSLANQTDKRFKVYIGNDASPEDPLDVLENYKGQFDFVYHIFEENLGGISLVKQWERCIALSEKEEWIMILGDDDVLDNSVVGLWHEKYSVYNEKSNVVRFASKIIYEETQTVSTVYHHPIWESATDSFYRKYENLTRSSLSEYVFSRASYLKYGFHDYPLGWYSDDHAWLNFSEDKLIYSINDCLVLVRMSDINISGKLDNVELKRIATSLFFGNLIDKKLSRFNKEQRLELLYKFEVVVKTHRKLNIKEWFVLVRKYLINFHLIFFVKFSRRFIKSYFDL